MSPDIKAGCEPRNKFVFVLEDNALPKNEIRKGNSGFLKDTGGPRSGRNYTFRALHTAPLVASETFDPYYPIVLDLNALNLSVWKDASP
jgi:hypothetical protein